MIPASVGDGQRLTSSGRFGNFDLECTCWLSSEKNSARIEGNVHWGALVSGVTVPCNPNLIRAPRMIPAGIATYYTFLGHLGRTL
jgi:hypothetical protein